MISGINSALAGLHAFEKKAESSANNTANINTDGYKKTRVTLEEAEPQGVKPNVERIETPGPLVYEQTSEGETLVEKSNVELTYELPNMMLSRRFYQANIMSIQIQDEMLGSLLDIKG
ncbi:MAG: flagellar biosynthesis protein FlgC [Desulfobulbaceae bacterium]|nr:flagellar biosynthesis protein FlgC [Desulfobulbaceae bacterium]MCK5545266.1 flagellar biosynthesis protein FlgC [Desulfobulbaceae bacterium]